MEEIIVYLLLALVFYCAGSLIYKFIMKNKETYDENDFAIVEYANGEEVKLVKNLETGVYEEIIPINWKHNLFATCISVLSCK